MSAAIFAALLVALTATLVALVPARGQIATPTRALHVNQAGYLAHAPKRATVVAVPAASAFAVRRASDQAVVLEGTLSAAVSDADSGDPVQQADFSSLTQPGTYVLDVKGIGRSWPFRVGADVYERPLYLALRSFYGQRCNSAVDLGAAFPGYAYGACHLSGRFHGSSGRSGERLPTGGWHDAGDYGRYVVNSGLTTGTLLWAFELYGDRLSRVTLDLPESANTTPDMLDEIRWNLNWMRSMQDADGGVWHKQTSERFTGFVMPDADPLASEVIGTGQAPYKSTCATADLAAVLAIAARLYAPYDEAFAADSLSAARRAFAWTESHPDVLFKNPAGVSTGEYGDSSCRDERLWAAAELWRTTREPQYEAFVTQHADALMNTIRDTGPPSWPSVAPMGLWSYALDRATETELARRIRAASKAAADAIVARTSAHGYRISLTTTDFVWGSNGVAANYGVQLLVAHALAPERAYVETALDNLHYLLGRNTFSLSFLSRVGANAFRHPHHRPSGADRNAEPWPGLLSGGPNRRKQDPAMQKLPDLPPAKMYIDDQESYASNENAINWNAPLVFLLAGVQPEHANPDRP